MYEKLSVILCGTVTIFVRMEKINLLPSFTIYPFSSVTLNKTSDDFATVE